MSQTINWEDYLCRSSQDPTLKTLRESSGDAFSILQVRFGPAASGWHFKSWTYLSRRDMVPSFSNYEIIYTAPLPWFRDRTEALESIYDRFRLDLPQGFCGHTLVVSDVVVLKMDGFVSAHYVDKFGFRTLDGFLTGDTPIPEPEPEKAPAQTEPIWESEEGADTHSKISIREILRKNSTK